MHSSSMEREARILGTEEIGNEERPSAVRVRAAEMLTRLDPKTFLRFHTKTKRRYNVESGNADAHPQKNPAKNQQPNHKKHERKPGCPLARSGAAPATRPTRSPHPRCPSRPSRPSRSNRPSRPSRPTRPTRPTCCHFPAAAGTIRTASLIHSIGGRKPDPQPGSEPLVDECLQSLRKPRGCESTG